MAKWEVKNLFRLPSGRYLPCGLNIVQKLWWRFMPGVIINVKWPKGMIIAGPGPEDPRWFDYGGAAYIKFESADPNDHYRPELTKLVGRQGIHWNWGLTGNDAAENRLTIKIIKSKEQAALLLALKWG